MRGFAAETTVPVEKSKAAYVVMPNGQSVGEWLRPQLTAVYEQRTMPPLLPDLSKETP